MTEQQIEQRDRAAVDKRFSVVNAQQHVREAARSIAPRLAKVVQEQDSRDEFHALSAALHHLAAAEGELLRIVPSVRMRIT